MAYMDQANKKRLAGLAKKALSKWPAVKWSVAVRNHSTVVLTVNEGDLDFLAGVASEGPHLDSLRKRLAERGDTEVQHYTIERDWAGDARAFLLAARTALETGNHNRNDAQSDYYDVGWYIKIQIGRFDRPYRFTGETPLARAAEAAAAIPATGVVSESAIERARGELTHGCDGPVTAFVLMCRATEYAHRTGEHAAAANALDEALREFGYLAPERSVSPTDS